MLQQHHDGTLTMIHKGKDGIMRDVPVKAEPYDYYVKFSEQGKPHHICTANEVPAK